MSILVVTLGKEHAADARKIATQRNNKKAAWDKKFSDNHTSFDIHYMSALAEVAWEYLVGWSVDREERLGGDRGVDFTNEGRTYELKARDATGFPNPDLLVRLDYARADRFLLAEVDVENIQVSFIGWCTKEELKSKIVNIKGKGERYIRERKLLRPIPTSLILLRE